MPSPRLERMHGPDGGGRDGGLRLDGLDGGEDGAQGLLLRQLLEEVMAALAEVVGGAAAHELGEHGLEAGPSFDVGIRW